MVDQVPMWGNTPSRAQIINEPGDTLLLETGFDILQEVSGDFFLLEIQT